MSLLKFYINSFQPPINGFGKQILLAQTESWERVFFIKIKFIMALLLDDARVIHETTPIFPDHAVGEKGYRDTLVLTYRAQGFQAP